MTGIDFFSEQQVVQFSISNDPLIKLDCMVTDKWSNILALNLECGSKHEIKLTRKTGITSSQRQDFELSLQSSLGLDIAGLKAKIAKKHGHEFTFEESLEEESTFTFEAPKCGRRTVALYQRVRVYNFTYKDLRWNHRHSWSKSISERLPPIHDDTQQVENDPKCGCDKQPKEGKDGMLLAYNERLSLLLGYTLTPKGAFVKQLDLNLNSEVLQPILSGAESLIAVSRDSVPKYLSFLANISGDKVAFKLTKALQGFSEMRLTSRHTARHQEILGELSEIKREIKAIRRESKQSIVTVDSSEGALRPEALKEIAMKGRGDIRAFNILQQLKGKVILVEKKLVQAEGIDITHHVTGKAASEHLVTHKIGKGELAVVLTPAKVVKGKKGKKGKISIKLIPEKN